MKQNIIDTIIKLAIERKGFTGIIRDLPDARAYLNKLSTFKILKQLIKEY
tara:strand:+ start:309 stop:458 length:150 start_codon:yes stop_codon:yes gene_type:complete